MESSTIGDVHVEHDIDTSNGDHDVFAHYALKDQITEAIVTGVPIVALCGKVWIPSRDPQQFPICPTCKEIYTSFFSDV